VAGPFGETIALYYDATEALRRAGAPVSRDWPTPFPADRWRSAGRPTGRQEVLTG
jgi:hypothetical protein